SKEPIKLCLGQPIPQNPELVDYHSNPTNPVISKRLFNILSPLNIYGIQLVPAKVRNPNGGPFDEPRDYWFMHVWNRIACLDKNKSELELYDDGDIFSIERLSLNETILGQVDLKHRQIFELADNTSTLLIHQSVKDAILSIDPVGCRFFKATEWNSDIVFD
ncbi:MAG: DUF1629 domain-containing protein, partial [Pseudomonadota bacterium]